MPESDVIGPCSQDYSSWNSVSDEVKYWVCISPMHKAEMKLNFLLFLKFQPLRNLMAQFSPLQGSSFSQAVSLSPWRRELGQDRKWRGNQESSEGQMDTFLQSRNKQRFWFLTVSILCFFPSIMCSYRWNWDGKIRSIIILGQNYGKICVMGTRSLDHYKEVRLCVFVMPFVWSALSALKQAKCAGRDIIPLI